MSMPMTMNTVWFTHSGITGFTLPGMIDDPAWRGGSWISASPARGPLASRRRSLAILPKCSAVRLITLESMTKSLTSEVAPTGSAAGRMGRPVMVARWRAASSRKRTSAQMPVPIAVPAKVHHAERFMLLLQQCGVGTELAGECAEFLAEGHGHGVLQLGAADFHHGHGALRQRRERSAELAGAVDQGVRGIDQGKACGGGVGVVGGLGFVHGVVRVDDLVFAARVVAEFQCSVRDDLIDVHVGRGACAALQHVDGELVVELACDHVGAGTVDRVRPGRRRCLRVRGWRVRRRVSRLHKRG